MSNQPHPANSAGNGGYERRDIGVAGVLYFLLGLAVAGLLVYFVVNGIYHYLDKRSEAEQAPRQSAGHERSHGHAAHPRRTTRRAAFPNPKLEEDERGQLNGIRLKEEQTLSTYDYIDKNAGTVRIPIERAMDLIVQRGLPVRAQSAATPAAQPKPVPESQAQKKGTKK